MSVTYDRVSTNAEDIGPRIRTARMESGLTQEQLGAAVDRSQNYVAKMESGKRAPARALLERLALALGRPVSWFYGEDASKPSDAAPVVPPLKTKRPRRTSQIDSNAISPEDVQAALLEQHNHLAEKFSGTLLEVVAFMRVLQEDQKATLQAIRAEQKRSRRQMRLLTRWVEEKLKSADAPAADPAPSENLVEAIDGLRSDVGKMHQRFELLEHVVRQQTKFNDGKFLRSRPTPSPAGATAEGE